MSSKINVSGAPVHKINDQDGRWGLFLFFSFNRYILISAETKNDKQFIYRNTCTKAKIKLSKIVHK